jgi:Flp pilus assembly protein TadD
MRFFTIAFFVTGMFLQVGCASMLTPRATPRRLRAYNDQILSEYISANQFEKQGKFEKARELYQQLHEKHPKNPDYLHRLGVVNTRLQRHGEASSYYEQARNLDPKNVRLLADMGYSAYLMGDLPGAEQILRDALRLKPGDPRTTNNLALVVGARGNMEESLALLREVSSDVDALASLAYIHVQKGETKEAEQRYREALEIDPKLKYATTALAELEKRHPQQNVFAAPESDEMTFDIAPTSTEVTPVIQQTNSVFDEVPSKRVVTANFTKNALDFDEPAQLDPLHEFGAQPLKGAAEQEFDNIDNESGAWDNEASSSDSDIDSSDDWSND